MEIATGQVDHNRTGYLLGYPYFKKYNKIISIDLNKQQVLDADLKAIQQINFTENLDRAGTHYWRSERNHFRFFTRNSYSIIKLFCFNIILI